ncbi:MAG TPA: hypothetical protein VMW72_21460 [Sedimentisphaerales bacterium]|nr:hypothetical protein [Sedimentisphaerales bacterium]
MSRYYYDKKDTVEDCRSVSISFLRKHGYLSEPCSMSGSIVWKNYYGEETSSIGIVVSTLDDNNYIRFQYTTTDRNTGEKTEYDYKVQLTTTPCNFGGVRYWFICPLSRNGVYCGRRVAKLYKAPGGGYFGCRHCYNLSYESRNEPCLARYGGIGYPIKAERLYEELYKKTKRWTYKGKPTKKARKLKSLEKRMAGVADVYDLLLKR